MNAIIGVGLMTLAALLLAWAHGQFLRPQPKAWTKGDFAAVTITLTIVCLFTFSLAYLGVFLFNLGAETRWLEIVSATGGALLLCWFLIPRLKAPSQRAVAPRSAAAASPAPELPEPANDPRPTSPARPGPSSRRPRRNRAA